MIKAIIVDDENNARELLGKLLNRYFAGKIIVLEKCDSVDSAVLAIQNHKPDIVFLDIQMPHKNGFELFKEVTEVNFETIFVTAYKDFAVNAIKCSALDYLLKPINHLDLMSAIKRFETKQNSINNHNRIELLLDNLNTEANHFNKIVLPTDFGFELVKPSHILYCEADGNYTKVNLLDGKVMLVAKTLKYIEELLANDIFIRTHKSYVVNINYVSRFDKSNDLHVVLSNNEKIPVSVRKKDDFINAVLCKK
jgi:two-component system LytT family response regulator